MVGSHDNQDDGDFNALEPFFFLQPYYFESLSTVHTPVNFQKASKRIIFLDGAGVAYFVHTLAFFSGQCACLYNTIWPKSFKKLAHNLSKN